MQRAQGRRLLPKRRRRQLVGLGKGDYTRRLIVGERAGNRVEGRDMRGDLAVATECLEEVLTELCNSMEAREWVSFATRMSLGASGITGSCGWGCEALRGRRTVGLTADGLSLERSDAGRSR